MTSVSSELLGKFLQDEKFTIVEIVTDPETENLTFTIVHDMHPDDELVIELVSNESDGEDSMQLRCEGPDSYTEVEAKQVLQEVMDVIVKVVEEAIKLEQGSGSGSASGGSDE